MENKIYIALLHSITTGVLFLMGLRTLHAGKYQRCELYKKQRNLKIFIKRTSYIGSNEQIALYSRRDFDMNAA